MDLVWRCKNQALHKGKDLDYNHFCTSLKKLIFGHWLVSKGTSLHSHPRGFVNLMFGHDLQGEMIEGDSKNWMDAFRNPKLIYWLKHVDAKLHIVLLSGPLDLLVQGVLILIMFLLIL